MIQTKAMTRRDDDGESTIINLMKRWQMNEEKKLIIDENGKIIQW